MALLRVYKSILERNISILKSDHFIGKKKILMVVCKNNGYGIGYGYVPWLNELGIKYIATYSIEELRVLQRVFNGKILLLSCTSLDEDELRFLIENKIIINITSISLLEKIISLKDKNKLYLSIHISLYLIKDGVGLEDLDKVIATIHSIRGSIEELHISSHVSTCQDIDKSIFLYEISAFKYVVKRFLSFNISYIHLCSSRTLSLSKYLDDENMVRAGISVYGMKGIRDKSLNSLTLIGNLYATVKSIKRLKYGYSYQYSNRYNNVKNKYIAVISIGYGDWPFICKDVPMLINNKYYYPMGSSTMNITLLSVDETVNVNDTVTIFDNKYISLLEYSKQFNVEPISLMVRLSESIKREYIS